jgi:hypothetical protein
MFTTAAMTAYQSLLDKTYKPPSIDMIKRRLSELARESIPVRFLVLHVFPDHIMSIHQAEMNQLLSVGDVEFSFAWDAWSCQGNLERQYIACYAHALTGDFHMIRCCIFVKRIRGSCRLIT